jgi:hypothetical protein
MVVNFIIAVIAVGLSALLGYWASDREPPVELRSVEPVQTSVPPGGVLKLKYQLVRKRVCRVHLEQLIYDADNTRVAEADEDYYSAPGSIGAESFALQIRVPYEASEGQARYRSFRTYYCNPLHTWFDWPIVVGSADINFEIRKDAHGRPNGAGMGPP